VEKARKMARIIIRAVHADGESRRWTLSESIVAENLDSEHYVTQLIECLSWATAGAGVLKSQSADLAADHDDAAPDGGDRRARLKLRSRGHNLSRGSGSRPIAGDRRVRA